MNNDRVQGSWEQVKGHVQKAWGKLTNDDLDVIEGDRKLLAGKIQERYGIAKDEADRQVDEWNKRHDA
ncbi:CsbD family protein [Asticcacaulis sp. 201]|uniref:CsbD family protein n=1 Tax=Asticcacaulis sp. 201 TaxID=3028787 RepID=UPI002915F1B9|nr:CsbD family protein [Asticcacaulis sp. 201]MDV6332148.1 CsbD family protein [Asticcacaulis sp. 201]